jgi:hypothetical protein
MRMGTESSSVNEVEDEEQRMTSGSLMSVKKISGYCRSRRKEKGQTLI